MKDIETGVDKLVTLIDDKKKITLDQAAKNLGVSTVLVQEWADFLEEDGLISIEYSLSKVWLVEKKLSKKDVVKKERDYESKKDSFIRKVDSTLKSLDKDTSGFEKMKKEFTDLKKDIGGEIGFVKKELKELEYYENLKKNIDKDVEKQKAEFLKMMDKSHLEIKSEERRYKEMLAQVEVERAKVSKERKDVKSLEDKEVALMKQIDAINESVALVRKEIKEENKMIDVTESHVDKLEKFANNVEKRLKDKKNDAIMPLVRLSEKHRERIGSLQDEMIEKLQKKKSEIDDYKRQNKKVTQNLQKFFDKKEKAEALLKKIDLDKQKLRLEYDELTKKAMSFNVISKKSSVKKHMADLEKSYKQVEAHKLDLKKELKELSKVLKG